MGSYGAAVILPDTLELAGTHDESTGEWATVYLYSDANEVAKKPTPSRGRLSLHHGANQGKNRLYFGLRLLSRRPLRAAARVICGNRPVESGIGRKGKFLLENGGLSLVLTCDLISTIKKGTL